LPTLALAGSQWLLLRRGGEIWAPLLNRTFSDVNLLAILFFGGTLAIIFYSVNTEIVGFPTRLREASLLVLDAPLQMIWLTAGGGGSGLAQVDRVMAYLVHDFFVEASGFFLAFVVIALLPELADTRPMTLGSSFSREGVILAGVFLGLWGVIYLGFGRLTVIYTLQRPWYQQIALPTAVISTVILYVRYMDRSYSRDNTVWILVCVLSWVVGVLVVRPLLLSLN
jgi:hypothetical protein